MDNAPLERADCVVIGAGVVGLATARRLALAGREVIILEAESAIGTGTSARNSEVIHAGIYYPKDSLKARLCVSGRRRLVRYCAERHIPHRLCGKLIVAVHAGQQEALAMIASKARANGVESLETWTGAQAMALEPALICHAALYSPGTGIIDSHALMLSYLGDATAAGAMLALNSPVIGGQITDDGIILNVGGNDPMRLSAATVINAGGLYAQTIARCLTGLPVASIPPQHFAKGNYFTLASRAPFSRLIYPVPEPGGLGVHVTLDLAGQMRFGPDVEWLDDLSLTSPDDRPDYTVTPARANKFYHAIRRYWPDLPDGALQPGYSGIRPKLAPQGSPDSDFLIQGPETHGVPGLINLYGIESPGLTASLALADAVAEMAGSVGVANMSRL